jgi:1-deoxy-D-xylulose-5-phosphate reductoisomerase
MTKQVTLLGATGSIGLNTLDVISRHPENFTVFALTAHKNWQPLLELAQRFQPKHVVLVDATAAANFKEHAQALKLSCEVHQGEQALCEVAASADVDIVMAAIVGAAGLLPTLAAAQAGKRILLANKEALVMTGKLFMQAAKSAGATILPVDSEHNAIFQCMPASSAGQSLAEMGIRKLILTASGGPFLKTPMSELKEVTPEQACKHPNWSMGKKISVDSATMMNKGLEVIEAHWLFNAAISEIEVIIQPQSIIHSMVEYCDGSVLAELGLPDMRTPIAHVLGLPTRINSGVGSLNFTQLGALEFLPLDFARFPMMKLAYDVLALEGTAATWLNAANEVLVEAFLQGKISFLQMPELLEQTLNKYDGLAADSIDNILHADERARQITNTLLGGR